MYRVRDLKPVAPTPAGQIIESEIPECVAVGARHFAGIALQNDFRCFQAIRAFHSEIRT
jgi:hypothetical protein